MKEGEIIKWQIAEIIEIHTEQSMFMVGIFIVLTKYISLNINMTQKAREIASLRKELSTMTMENDNLEISINSSIDYDYIYKVATEELGMVYPSCSQIVSYDSEDSEYVVQYKDVE